MRGAFTSITAPIFVTAAAPSGFPDASNTGAKGALTPSGSVNSASAGQTIQNLDITGIVRIRHNNVTLQNCRITSDDGIIVEVDAGTPTGVIVQDCTIIGTVGAGQTGWNPDGGGGGSIIRRCDISNVENGIGIGENAMQILDNYIHDLATGALAHTDGIQGTGGFTALTIDHNSVFSIDTSCCIMQNEGGGFSGLVINNNQLVMLNGSAAIIIRGDKGVGTVGAATVTNNHLGKSSGGTYNDIQSITGPLTYTGNVDWITGAPITSGQ